MIFVYPIGSNGNIMGIYIKKIQCYTYPMVFVATLKLHSLLGQNPMIYRQWVATVGAESLQWDSQHIYIYVYVYI